MSITLYRPGNSHERHGIKCEARVFNEYSYLHLLDLGWFYSPEECYQEAVEEVIEEAIEVPVEIDGLLIISEMSDEEIRLLAKARGIKSWHNKGIDKLKAELDSWQPEI